MVRWCGDASIEVTGSFHNTPPLVLAVGNKVQGMASLAESMEHGVAAEGTLMFLSTWVVSDVSLNFHEPSGSLSAHNLGRASLLCTTITEGLGSAQPNEPLQEEPGAPSYLPIRHCQPILPKLYFQTSSLPATAGSDCSTALFFPPPPLLLLSATGDPSLAQNPP